MFFIYKTSYSIKGASLEKETESFGKMFIHDTGRYENKICVFGKIMALLAIILAVIRLYFLQYPESKRNIIYFTLTFDCLCLVLAANMNLNALIYLLPIVFVEVYILTSA
jgi:hypothetical protein